MTARRRLLPDCSVDARFSLSDIPRISVVSAPDDASAAAARAVAVRALTETGRGYLGGRIELRTHGRCARPRALRRAADSAVALAVAATLRGETTGVRVHVRPLL
ncbi:hypothetical protein P3L51_31535 [Streptomyces sp. PSRA5]|uniref:hypothetical protein n=1 Tax=Streptomyces panacea TaxID=3035064 RepID=UPI00339BB8F5